LLDIVAEAARAELAEIGEVLAKLGGLDAGDLGERLAGKRCEWRCPSGAPGSANRWTDDKSFCEEFPGDRVFFKRQSDSAKALEMQACS